MCDYCLTAESEVQSVLLLACFLQVFQQHHWVKFYFAPIMNRGLLHCHWSVLSILTTKTIVLSPPASKKYAASALTLWMYASSLQSSRTLHPSVACLSWNLALTMNLIRIVEFRML